MSESLEAACGQFEQVILAQMLRTAGIGRSGVADPSADPDVDGDDDDAGRSSASDDAFSQLVTQSLAGAVERAGGIGLKADLLAAAERQTR